MFNYRLIKKILDQYPVCIKDNIRWQILDTYPHVIKIEGEQDTFYLKEIVVDRNRKKWIEFVYSAVATEKMIIHPMKNLTGSYISSVHEETDFMQSEQDNEYGYLLTRAMRGLTNSPSAEWWADCLIRIHKKNDICGIGRATFGDFFEQGMDSRNILPRYSEVIEELEKISNLMEQDVKNLIFSIVPVSEYTSFIKEKAVLVHGDPLISNVLSDGSINYLFDFESSGVSVKEYDIQRLFVDFATNCSEREEIDSFVELFFNSYEQKSDKINKKALDYILRLDLIRTLCWLYKVSVSYNRQDLDRQSRDLEKYKKALRRGFFHRIISAINKTWPYCIDNIRLNNQNEILNVAHKISAIVPDFVCATLGGSRSNFLDDVHSDAEMYFYSKSSIPSIDMLNVVLEKAGAIHRRSSSFLWNEAPWGPHSFFEINGLYFEVGYRILDDVKRKIEKYICGEAVEPQRDCHDLGLGYLFSGLTASVQAEKVLICQDMSFFELKELADKFPDSLRIALWKEYMETARNLIKGKLLVAVQRQDLFFYNVISTRVIRCLMIMAFSISNTHFPGDKWNETLLLHTKWNNASRFLQLLSAHMRIDAGLSEKHRLLSEAFTIIETDYLLMHGESFDGDIIR